MDELLRRVLQLNADWNAQNTPEMAERGRLIRRDIPGWLRQITFELAAASGREAADIGIEGRDGTGLKTEVPWVRVHSKELSPHATEGWYIVYLFDALGHRVYLSLNQGTTEWTGADYRPRPLNELRRRVDWARAALGAENTLRAELLTDIKLLARRSYLGSAYESGNVVAIGYDAAQVVTQAELAADVTYMSRLLGRLYALEAVADHVPGNTAPELRGAMSALERAAGAPDGRRRGGQGFGLTKAEQDAVEDRAVALAMSHLNGAGWNVTYVGATSTWDCEATRGNDKIFVEVKGTTSAGESVLLTGAQVRKYREKYPATALLVVHDIVLDRSASPPTASGGNLVEVRPWKIVDDDLTPLAWTYRTGL